MARYQFTLGDARDYFKLGRIEPGDEREFTVPPDTHWRRVDTPTPTAVGESFDAAADQAEVSAEHIDAAHEASAE